MVPSNFLTLECPFPSLIHYALESHWDFPPLTYIKLCILKDFHSFCLQPRTLNIPLSLSGPSRVQFSIVQYSIQYIVQHSIAQFSIDDWENAIALDTIQGNRASSRREGKVSWVFSSLSGTWGIFSSYSGDVHSKLQFVH